MLSSEMLLQLLVSVTAILFGLFGVFMAGYEFARTRVGQRWKAYAILSASTGIAIILGASASLLAFWVADGRPFMTGSCSALKIAADIFQILMVIEICAILLFGAVYVWAK